MHTIFLKIFTFLSVLPVSVGNHTDYSGGSDFGGGGSDFGGSDFSTFTYSGGGSGGGSDTGDLIGGIIIVAVLFFVFYVIRHKKNTTGQGFAPTPNIPVPHNNNENVIAAIKANDPDFSSERFLSWSEQVFVQLQQAWTERDWKKARPFESEELFNLHKSQLDEYIRNGTINVMENVCVNESWFLDYKTENNHEYVTVFMQTRYNDYIIKEDTGEVIKGSKDRTYRVNYKLKFMRSLGVKTGDLSNKSTHNCPNCGAPVDVNAAGQCAYCGTVITDGEHDWVLCNLDDAGQA